MDEAVPGQGKAASDGSGSGVSVDLVRSHAETFRFQNGERHHHRRNDGRHVADHGLKVADRWRLINLRLVRPNALSRNL
ncbi:hypothetical protein [Rhodoligotrophos appendicifer]|uniref:hypothetical protein n=1 Tax=Rhodoligotrophos appendicifer TaxID=987056 RepID=UPI001186249A